MTYEEKESKTETPKPQEEQEEVLKEKNEQLEKDLEEAEKKAELYLNRLKYAKADFENLQKQNQKRLQEILERANGQLLEQLLPVLDELNILSNTDTIGEKLQEGVSMVYKKLEKIMYNEGIKSINSLGEPFDPFKHEALIEVETDKYPEGCVMEEIRGGYMYKDKILRPSVVKVARSPSIKVEIKNE
jgi:molecular chaperone GrpE